MPLPQQVVDQVEKGTSGTQGWAWGAVFFSGGMLLVVIIIWAGLRYGAERYWNNQIASTQIAIASSTQSVSASDQQQIVTFYSQTANLKEALANHQFTSQLFPWLEKNTEANVYYQSFQLSQGNVVALRGVGKTEADINQQVALFEGSPQVQNVALSGVSLSPVGGGYTFSIALTMDPSIFSSPSL